VLAVVTWTSILLVSTSNINCQVVFWSSFW
jgi:hypothetical protein